MTESPILERARALGPQIRAAADEAERERHIPQGVAEAMAAAGLYRVAAPESLGGAEADPVTQIRTIEEIAIADGASGWTLMIGIEVVGMLGPNLPPQTAREVYADPNLIIAGALNPLGRALAVDGGYTVSGQWPFASGVHNSQYFWGQCIVVDGAGESLPRDDGFPQLIEALIPRDQFEILDTWHTSGLRGTGSHDVRAEGVFVPDDHITRTQGGGRPSETGPLFRFPPFSRLAYNKVGVATGIARGAIDAFIELASTKKPRAAFKFLNERTSAQLAAADAERHLRSSRAFVLESVEDMWQTVCSGDKPTDLQRARVQLACSHAAEACVRAVEPLVTAAGTSVNAASSRLGRCWRDVQVVRQHIMVSGEWIEAAGRTHLGLPSQSPFF